MAESTFVLENKIIFTNNFMILFRGTNKTKIFVKNKRIDTSVKFTAEQNKTFPCFSYIFIQIKFN